MLSEFILDETVSFYKGCSRPVITNKPSREKKKTNKHKITTRKIQKKTNKQKESVSLLFHVILIL